MSYHQAFRKESKTPVKFPPEVTATTHMETELYRVREESRKLKAEIKRLQGEVLKANKYVDTLQKENIVLLAEKTNLGVEKNQLIKELENVKLQIKDLANAVRGYQAKEERILRQVKDLDNVIRH